MAATTALAVSGGFDLLGGVLGMSAADYQSRALEQRAALLRSESEADIARYKDEAAAFKAEQAVRYGKAGVALEGSPLAILDETTRVSMENISAMRSKARMEASSLQAQGANIQAASRTQFLQSAARVGQRTISTGSRLGWFTKAAPESTEIWSGKGTDQAGGK